MIAETGKKFLLLPENRTRTHETEPCNGVPGAPTVLAYNTRSNHRRRPAPATCTVHLTGDKLELREHFNKREAENTELREARHKIPQSHPCGLRRDSEASPHRLSRDICRRPWEGHARQYPCSQSRIYRRSPSAPLPSVRTWDEQSKHEKLARKGSGDRACFRNKAKSPR